MSSKAINILLHRPLKKGTEYNGLLPVSDCSATKLADGNTKVAIESMAYWSKKYQHHTKALAQQKFAQLPLSKLCKALHGFLYHHLQYKIDDYKQLLRSPACAWATRSQGVDCKSFSIFGSTVLLNCGVSHYLRRVVQNEGEGYSHVYVIVPKNQQTFNLQSGYYTVDGTLKTNKEQPFFKADDVFISATQNGLAGVPTMNVRTLLDQFQQLNPDNSDIEKLRLKLEATPPSKYKDLDFYVDGATLYVDGKAYQLIQHTGLNGAVAIVGLVIAIVSFLIDVFTRMWNPCAGSYYNPDFVTVDMQTKFQPQMNTLLQEISDAIYYENYTEIQNTFNHLLKEFDLGYAHYLHEITAHDGNNCSKATLKSVNKTIQGVKSAIDNLLKDFKKKYPRYKVTEITKRANTSNRVLYFVVPNTTNPIEANYRYITIEDTQRENTYQYDPTFSYGETYSSWFAKRYNYLQETQGKSKAIAWENESKQSVDEILSLRQNLNLLPTEKHQFEARHQADLYKLWLRYDANFNKWLLKEAGNKQKAYELANQKFLNELQLIKDKEAKKRAENLESTYKVAKYNVRKETGQMALLGVMGFGLMYYLNK